MYLIIKDNPEKAKQLLKTNRNCQIGEKITGDLIMISKLAAQNTDVFELGGVEKAPKKKAKARGKSRERKKFGPKQDKMMNNEERTK